MPFRLVAPSLSLNLEQLNEALTSEHKKENTIMARETWFLGMDIGKFEIYVFDAARQRHLTVPNSAEGHRDLVFWLGGHASTITSLEPTGGYEWAIREALSASGFDARQVCAAHMRAFARATGALASAVISMSPLSWGWPR